MKKILVTGASGYIGKHCIVQLLKEGYSVKGTVRDLSKCKKIKSDIEQYLSESIELDFVEATLDGNEGWDGAVRDCDAVSTAASGKTIPKFDKKWFKDGAYIALSSNADLPDELWLNSKLVADNWKMHIDWREEINSKNHSKIPIHGKLHGLIKSRKISDEDISEMGDIVTKKKNVIRGGGSVNIFLTGGMGIEDISWAYEIYKKAIKKSLGKSLKLWDAPYLY